MADRDWYNQTPAPPSRSRASRLLPAAVALGLLGFFGGRVLQTDPDPPPSDDAPVHVGAESDEEDPGERPELEGASYDVGDCVMWEERAGSRVDTDVVDCGEPHRIEITGQITLDGLGPDYPTQARWDAVSHEDCLAHNEAFLAAPLDPYGVVSPTTIVPTHESWEHGLRSVWCGLANYHPADLEGRLAFTGSVLEIEQEWLYPTGTCVDFDSPTPVLCDAPHHVEVTGSIQLDDGLVLPRGEDWGAWEELAAACEEISMAYVGHLMPSGYGWTWLHLEQVSYDAGGRQVHCGVGRWRGEEMIGTTGSVKAA